MLTNFFPQILKLKESMIRKKKINKVVREKRKTKSLCLLEHFFYVKSQSDVLRPK